MDKEIENKLRVRDRLLAALGAISEERLHDATADLELALDTFDALHPELKPWRM